MFVVCEKWVETRMDCYIDPSSSPDHSRTSSSTVRYWGPQKPSVCKLVLTLAFSLQLTWTALAPGYIIFLRSPASAVLPLIYTGASLDWQLGQGSIYNTANQDDLFYLARTFFPSSCWTLSLPHNLSNWTDVTTVCSPFSSSITTPWGNPFNLWISWIYSLRLRVPSWIWIRSIQSTSHRNNFTSPPKLAMSTAMQNFAQTSSYFIPG